jgi:hypothetical protein
LINEAVSLQEEDDEAEGEDDLEQQDKSRRVEE